MTTSEEDEGKYVSAKFWVLYIVGLVVVLILYRMCSTNSEPHPRPEKGHSKGSNKSHLKAPTAEKLKRS